MDAPAHPALVPDDAPRPPARSLTDAYGAVPLSVLDKRAGWWQSRRASWLDLGIRSEVGRDGALTYNMDFTGQPRGYTSVFDPVLCELVYHWWSRPGDVVLDPFCGGSVRGVVASWMGRWYYGADLRAEQIEADRAQSGVASQDCPPLWEQGDARHVHETYPDLEADLIFTCPPYADLERYRAWSMAGPGAPASQERRHDLITDLHALRPVHSPVLPSGLVPVPVPPAAPPGTARDQRRGGAMDAPP